MSEIEIIKDKVCFDEILVKFSEAERNVYLTGGTTNILADFYKKKCFDEVVQMLKDRGYLWTENNSQH